MLVSLQVKNFLLIKELELDFKSGLTVITGETGAGKSIIIDALSLIFGAKANADFIRRGEQQASLNAVFEVNSLDIREWLFENDFIDDIAEVSVICRRILDVNGKNKSYINGIAVTLAQVKMLGEMLLDIHAQHASIALLKTDNQLELLDVFSDNMSLRTDILIAYNEQKKLEQQLRQADEQQEELQVKQNILQEKIREAEELCIKKSEWTELEQEQKQLANANYILQELDNVENLISNEEFSLLDNVINMQSKISKLHGILPDLASSLQIAESIEIELNELSSEINSVVRKIEVNPERLLEVEERINEIYSFARKYRINPDEVSKCYNTWIEELALLKSSSDIELLKQQYQLAQYHYKTLANEISLSRKQAASKLSTLVTDILHQLSILGEFYIQLLPSKELLSTGFDLIEYQVCFNKGMELQALNKVASGGELSRVALALYVALSIKNPPELIVFDEVDVGIGGGVAEIVGGLLRTLGQSKQVLCITHQPQTACMGNQHLAVSKSQLAEITLSEIKYLENDDRVMEISRMLGGLNITQTTITHAKEMLGGNP